MKASCVQTALLLLAGASCFVTQSAAQSTCRDLTTQDACNSATIDGYNCRWSCSSIIPRPCICLQGDPVASETSVSDEEMSEFVQEGSNVLTNASILVNSTKGGVQAIDDVAELAGKKDNNASPNESDMASIDSIPGSAVPDGLSLSSDQVKQATLDANFAGTDLESEPNELDELQQVQRGESRKDDKQSTSESEDGKAALSGDTLKLPAKALPVLKAPKPSPFKLLKDKVSQIAPLKKYVDVLDKLDKLLDETGPIARKIERMQALKSFLQAVDQKLDLGDPVALYIGALEKLKENSPLDFKVKVLQALHEKVLKKPKKNKKLSGLALFAFKALKLAVLKGLVLKLGSEYINVTDLKSTPVQELIGNVPADADPLSALGFVDELGNFTPIQDLLSRLNIDFSSL